MSRHVIGIEQLVPGTVFLYHGPRTGWARRRGVAPGRVLALEPARQIVHVRTLFPRGASLEVEIGFMPLLFTMFRRSLAELGAVGDVPVDSWKALALWREEHAKGVAGAFSCQLWEAEKLAWEAVRRHRDEAARENTYVEYAFPRRGATGVFDAVAVSCLVRGPLMASKS